MRATILLVLAAACGGAHTRHQPTTGSIGGLVRDLASGDPVGKVSLELSNGAHTVSTPEGWYVIDNIRPGTYTLDATYAGQPVTIKNIPVRRGEAIFVDVNFTLGTPGPVTVDFGDAAQGEIKRYKSRRELTIIEGAVSELTTHEAVVGAVVTAVGGPNTETLQTVTNEQGRYRFDAVQPGTYVVSAYYNVGGRGQIEVRRSGIDVARAEGVIVPIWVELNKQ